MATKPAGLIYGVDDRPPASALALLAVQHIFLMSSSLVLPIVLVTEIGGGFTQVQAVVALTMMACGIGTILQAARWPGVGSGYLCPNLCGPNFFAASMSAAWLGGLPLMRGMTIAAGLVEMVFARFVHRLAFLFPTEITGLVVFMVAVSLVPVGTSKFLHIDYTGEPIQVLSLAAAAATFMVMVGTNIWGNSKLRLYGVLLGMATGYALSAICGLLPASQFEQVAKAPWLGWPALDGMFDIEFRWSLLPAFIIVSICGALKSFGNLVMCEKINDDDWKEPDTRRIGNGLMADGICVLASGLLGGVASDTSASNVSLSAASGATARVIGFAAGGLFIALGFSPKLSALLSIMPPPVAGAILVFVVCFMMTSGLQIMLSTKPDTRKTFVLGTALCFGLSLDILPDLYAHVAPWMRPLFESSLTLATAVAVILHQLLRLGEAKKTVAPASAPVPSVAAVPLSPPLAPTLEDMPAKAATAA
jgi:NCS2 family nucleobase:cation symporter-2